MITPSAITTQAIKVWGPTYLLMMVHGSTITTSDFFEFFVIYPLLCGTGLAAYTFYRDFETDEFLEQVGIGPNKNLIFGISLYIVLPVGFVLSSMLYAQFQNSYESVGWVAIVFGGLIIEQLATKVREIMSAKS